MIRTGLCCIFKDAPLKFRQTTAKALSVLSAKERIRKVSGLCLENTKTLLKALETVSSLNIKSFRILSPLFPIYTHPEYGYTLDSLPERDEIISVFEKIRKFRADNDIRLSFHPDQFIVISSPRISVVRNSISELRYQAMLCELVGADVINIHAGGVYGDKTSALKCFEANFKGLPASVGKYITLENDDVSYTVKDLAPLCRSLKIPLVYDVHHHRCNPDGLSISVATKLCVESWKRSGGHEAYFHISSPREGWGSGKSKPHADYIDIKDFPDDWLKLEYDFTLDIEAKAKELAVLKFMKEKKIASLLKIL
ncbi:MAG: UV damage repair endonuclease UvsE [Lentisphaerae bacterium GWF2_45_14]|nr:MAG: UV damage repair endonuclease UvsE [Lentisphaerae bacterium GWF2_45_14]